MRRVSRCGAHPGEDVPTELADSNRRPPGCDASARPAGHQAPAVGSRWNVGRALLDGDDRPAGRDACVCGVHIRRAGRVPNSGGI
jgi:hypothetical protein